MPARAPLTVVPLTPARFGDLEALFGPRGASSGCWCMFFRLPRREFRAGQGEPNRAAFRRYVGGRCPGLLAYDGATPVGWAAVEPRAAFPLLDARGRGDAWADGDGVWAVPCFFVAPSHRGRGVSRALLAAAAAHARRHGARCLEAYPEERDGHGTPAALYRGVVSTFLAMGFVEVGRRSPRRLVMRLALRPRRATARPAPPARGRAASRSTPRTRPARATARRRAR